MRIPRFAVLALAVTLFAPASAGQAAQQPDQVLAAVVGDARDAILRNRDRLQTVAGSGTELIREQLEPHVDNRAVARYVLGPAWRNATPAQRNAFEAVFTQHATATYGTILEGYAGEIAGAAEAVELTYTTRNQTDGRAVVRISFQSGGDAGGSVNIHMHRRDGAWKVFDARLAGLSLLTGWRGDIRERLERQTLAELITALRQRYADSPSSPGNPPPGDSSRNGSDEP